MLSGEIIGRRADAYNEIRPTNFAGQGEPAPNRSRTEKARRIDNERTQSANSNYEIAIRQHEQIKLNFRANRSTAWTSADANAVISRICFERRDNLPVLCGNDFSKCNRTEWSNRANVRRLDTERNWLVIGLRANLSGVEMRRAYEKIFS